MQMHKYGLRATVEGEIFSYHGIITTSEDCIRQINKYFFVFHRPQKVNNIMVIKKKKSYLGELSF